MAKKEQVKKYKNVIDGKVDKIKQYLKEKDYAIKLRQVKINNWIKNEEGYNGVMQKTLLTRSNLHAPVLFEGVQSMSSKLGQVPDNKFDTIPEGDKNAAEIMHHVVREDLDESNFDLVFENSKIEAGIYGRTIYKVIPGNDKQRVELVDSLAYLISPIARDTKTALYQGQQFIYKTLEQLYEEADEMEYDTQELDNLKNLRIPNEVQGDASSEASLKNIRMANMGLANVTNYGSKVAEITEWVTYIVKGKKAELHHLTVANDVYLLRCIPSIEMGLKRPNFISWGTYPRGITFWCPSVADIYRDPNLAVDVNLNQQIDNHTYRNFGMAYVSSNSGLKQSSINPRPLGLTTVEMTAGEKITDHIFYPEIPEIGDAVLTMQTIKGFADSASGLIPSAPQTKGKISVTKQAQLNAEVEDKIKVMKRNVTNACQELFQLMADITSEKLTKPRTVKVLGLKNLTIENVTKKNFKDVKLVAKTTPAEDSQQNKAIKQKAFIEFYQLVKDDPKIPGQTELRKELAKKFDLPIDIIDLLFTEEQGNPQPIIPNNIEVPPTGNPPAPNSNPPTPATPLLSATGQAAAAQVPNAIR